MAFCGQCGTPITTPFCVKCGAPRAEQFAELWGTFAVDDHLRPRPFVAEAILFDRLVIPTPPDWSDNELEHWPRTWQPRLLRPLLEVLGNRAIPVPWDQSRRDRWQTAYDAFQSDSLAERETEATAVTFDVDILRSFPDTPAKSLSRSMLKSEIDAVDDVITDRIRWLPIAQGFKIETVAAYGSFAPFQQAAERPQPVQPYGDPRKTMLLTWDFFVPDDSNLTDLQLLERVVKLNDNAEFVEHRHAFQRLRNELMEQQLTPAQARHEMEERLAAYNGILASVATLKVARSVLTVATTTAPLLEFVHPGVGTVSGVGTSSRCEGKGGSRRPRLA